MRPIILSIAGSDSSAGAGIQADLKTIEAHGGYALTVVTAITAQSSTRVRQTTPIDAALVRAQLETVLEELDVSACKSGMLACAATVRVVAEGLRRFRPAIYVCDPVIRASDGTPLLDDEGLSRLKQELLPLCTVVTPNAAEAEALTGIPVRDPADARRAGQALVDLGAGAALITGGHLDGSGATDILVTAETSEEFTGTRLDGPDRHGTGCTFSAALVTQLARGVALTDAIHVAKQFVTRAIRFGLPHATDGGPVDALYFLHGVSGESDP